MYPAIPGDEVPGSKKFNKLTVLTSGLTVNTYIAYPQDNKVPEKAIVFLTDVFGIFSNAQMLADEFAKSGYLTVIPDLFQGDQISVDDMDSGIADLASWLPKHQTANLDPIVEAAIKFVRETLGVKKVGAVGYCLGAKVCCISWIRILLAVPWRKRSSNVPTLTVRRPLLED
jgi:dienelactone hydrolase